jgi:hypothetical protein
MTAKSPVPKRRRAHRREGPVDIHGDTARIEIRDGRPGGGADLADHANRYPPGPKAEEWRETQTMLTLEGRFRREVDFMHEVLTRYEAKISQRESRMRGRPIEEHYRLAELFSAQMAAVIREIVRDETVRNALLDAVRSIERHVKRTVVGESLAGGREQERARDAERFRAQRRNKKEG